MNTQTRTRILRLDAAANVLSGTALAVAGGLLAAPLGLATAWPVRIVGLALIVYGAENLLVARRTSRGGLTALIAADLAFAVVMATVAIADPTGAETWARWGLVGVADVSAAFGIAKVIGLRSLATARPASDAA